MRRDFAYRWLALLPLAVLGVGCSSDSPAASGGAGALGSSGANSSASGSGPAGAPSAAGGSGGSSGSGDIGGSTGSAGAPSNGGAGAAAGGASGGAANASAGNSSSGGVSGSAGTSAAAGKSGAGGTTGSAGAGPAHSGPWKIMPLGDSITGFCYPQNLAGEFASAGLSSKVNFIGTVTNNQSCNSPTVATLKTEGHGCYLVTYLQRDISTVAGCDGTKGTLSELKTWAAEKPDVVLMEIGTNDVWNATSTTSVTGAYTFVVDHFRAENPNVIFFVAQITPMNPGSSSGGNVTLTCTDCEGRVEALNAAIPGWASSKSTTASPIYVVNVWSALDKNTYLPGSSFTTDGVHPQPPAAKLMADKWYAALIAHGISQ